MAAKSQEASTEDVEELLDAVDKTMERLKTLYEQYFLGIQKQAPAYIHTDVERKLRDLQQLQIRNTGLRYRLVTLQQKFGSYNSYWRRTLRQIENGTYLRNLSKIGREAARSGAEVPEEILAAMPKRMREQVLRDREQALDAAARRRHDTEADDVDVDLGDMPPEATDDLIAMIKEPTDLRRNLKTRGGAHLLEDEDVDLDALFAAVEAKTSPPGPAVQPTPPPRQTQPMAAVTPRQSQPMAAVTPRQSQPMAAVTPPRQSQPMAAVEPPETEEHPTDRLTPVQRGGARPASAPPASGPAARPSVPLPARPGVPAPVRPGLPTPPAGLPVRAPSQTTRPNPISPGAAAARGAVPVESMAGPFPREPSGPITTDAASRVPIPKPPPAIPRPPAPGAAPRAATSPGEPSSPSASGSMPRAATSPGASGSMPRAATSPGASGSMPRAASQPGAPRASTSPGAMQARPQQPRAQSPRPEPAPPQRPPPGMTDADVNALYAKYVKAKEMVGEKVGPGEHSKLLRTINAQAPKIMEQYKAKAVDFSVVVKDNQVIIRAKPKT